jgi:hypothetical protein
VCEGKRRERLVRAVHRLRGPWKHQQSFWPVMTDSLPNGVVGSYPRELGSRRGNQSDPWIPTWPGTGEGDHIAARSLGGSTDRQRLVMGREAGGLQVHSSLEGTSVRVRESLCAALWPGT